LRLSWQESWGLLVNEDVRFGGLIFTYGSIFILLPQVKNGFSGFGDARHQGYDLNGRRSLPYFPASYGPFAYPGSCAVFPPGLRQAGAGKSGVFPLGNQIVIRLITSLGMIYEESDPTAFPFDETVSGRLDQERIKDTTRIVNDP
jgi:hypothetical protein